MQMVARFAAMLAALGPASAVFNQSNVDVSTLLPIGDYCELWGRNYVRLAPYAKIGDNENITYAMERSIIMNSNLTGADLIAGSLSREAPCADPWSKPQIPECNEFIPNVAYMSPHHPTYLRMTFHGGVDLPAGSTTGDAKPTTICDVPSQTLALVHSPKAGGETLQDSLSLKQYDMCYTYFHLYNPEEIAIDVHGTRHSFTHYMITMRDPLDRLRSSFNYMEVAEQELCFPLPVSDGVAGEGAFNAFAESLNSSSSCGEWARWVLSSPDALHTPQVRRSCSRLHRAAF